MTFFCYAVAFSVRPGLTFELAPGFIVWGGVSGGTGSNKRKYRTRRVKIGKGAFDPNQHQEMNRVQMRKTFNLGCALMRHRCEIT